MTDGSDRPSARVSLRDHAPLLVLIGLFIWGYVDLRIEVGELQARVDVMRVAPAGAVAGPAGLPAPGQPFDEVPPWPCAGTIPGEAVRQVVGKHGRAVFGCYDRRRAEVPAMEGTLALALLVASDGSVRSVKAFGTLRDEALLRCVDEDLRQWRFPVPTGGDCAVVLAPFLLAPEGAAPGGGQPGADGGG